MSRCWYCNEELTTANYCDEHIGICTKCYGSMFKVSNEFVKGLMDKISDLEAKLAEKEQQVKKWKQFYNIAIEDFNEMQEENNKLKQQLAEKDTKLHEYKRCALEDYNDNQKELLELKQQLAEKDNEFNWLHQKFAKYVERLQKLEGE